MDKRLLLLDPHRIPPKDTPSEDDLAAYGALSFLYTRSDAHQNVSLAEIRRVIQPAVDFHFYHIFRDPAGVPVAGAVWAFLGRDAQREYATTGKIAPRNWRTGHNLWIVEIIAPFGAGSASGAMRWIRKSLPPSVTCVRYLRVGKSQRADKPVLRVVECLRSGSGRLTAKLITPDDLP